MDPITYNKNNAEDLVSKLLTSEFVSVGAGLAIGGLSRVFEYPLIITPFSGVLFGKVHRVFASNYNNNREGNPSLAFGVGIVAGGIFAEYLKNYSEHIAATLL